MPPVRGLPGRCLLIAAAAAAPATAQEPQPPAHQAACDRAVQALADAVAMASLPFALDWTTTRATGAVEKHEVLTGIDTDDYTRFRGVDEWVVCRGQLFVTGSDGWQRTQDRGRTSTSARRLLQVVGSEPLACCRHEVTTLDDRPAEVLTLRLSPDQARRLLAELELLGRGQTLTLLAAAMDQRMRSAGCNTDVALTIDPSRRQLLRLGVAIRARQRAPAAGDPAPTEYRDGLPVREEARPQLAFELRTDASQNRAAPELPAGARELVEATLRERPARR